MELENEVGSDGGPLLALPVEAVASWGGILRADGQPALDGNFVGTDYGRACAVSESLGAKSPWGNYGFLDVGTYRGLVVHQRCELAQLEDGTLLLVMEGEGEDVAALLGEQKPWKKLDGEIDLPSGELVVFDSAMEHADTENKSTIKLEPGRYAVDAYDEDNKQRQIWVIRLSPLAT